MIKLFKRIRKRLITAGQLQQYLFYAIGEIALVVIGILIALQINNWNLKRLEKKDEIAILEGIAANILLDTIDINHNIRLYKNQITNDSSLVNHLILEKPNSPKIAQYMTSALYSNVLLIIHQSSFQQAKQRGLKIISNSELRANISRLYEFDYKYLLYIENESQPFFRTQLHELAQRYSFLQYQLDPTDSLAIFPQIPDDQYQALLQNKSFHFSLAANLMFERNALKKNYIPTKTKALQLVEEIRAELKRLKQ